MFVIYSVENKQGEVVLMSWHYATVMDFKLNRNCGYTYSSNVEGKYVEVISNNQATADTYRSMLKREMMRGKSAQMRQFIIETEYCSVCGCDTANPCGCVNPESERTE